jgi:hypothetical protein
MVSACSMQADFSSTQFLCDTDLRCPGAQVCVDGVCRSGVPDAGDATGDAAAFDPFLTPWQATSTLPQVRDYNHQHAVHLGDSIYLIGGYQDGEVDTVFHAQAGHMGVVGGWAVTTALPAPRALSDVVTSDGFLIVVGGAQGGVAQSTVYIGTPEQNGAVPSWTPTTSLPTPLKAHASVAADGYVYAIGGGDEANARVSTVYLAEVEEGAVGAWQETTALPEPRANAAGVMVEGFIYLIGGDDETETLRSTVYYAPVDPVSGEVGTWSTSPELPQARMAATAAANNGHVYLIGGQSGGATSQVLHARIQEDGSLGEWELNTGLPGPRTRHATAVVSNEAMQLTTFYVIGGTGGGIDVHYSAN